MIVCLPLESNIFDEADFMKQKETLPKTSIQPADEEPAPAGVKDMEEEILSATKRRY